MATSSEDVELTEAGVPGGFAPVSTSDAVLAVLEGEETALGADGSTLEGTAKGGKKGGKKASDGEEQGEAMGAVSVSALFRFAEAKDYVLTAIAMLCALFSGANQPGETAFAARQSLPPATPSATTTRHQRHPPPPPPPPLLPLPPLPPSPPPQPQPQPN